MKKGVKTRAITSSSRENGVSTRRMILDRANELINKSGLIDFRIDSLASSLQLSPGNITYHFPKRDDIGISLWKSCTDEVVGVVDHYITPLLDIKQLFLFYRFLVGHLQSHKGIVVFATGDMSIIARNMEQYGAIVKAVRHYFDLKIKYLVSNGYLKDISNKKIYELVFESQLATLGWCVNHELTTKGEISNKFLADSYAVLILTPLKPFLTEKGKEQFNNITISISK